MACLLRTPLPVSFLCVSVLIRWGSKWTVWFGGGLSSRIDAEGIRSNFDLGVEWIEDDGYRVVDT